MESGFFRHARPDRASLIVMPSACRASLIVMPSVCRASASGFRTVAVKSPISGGRFASPLRSSADGRAFDGYCPSTCGQRQRAVRSFAIEGQLVRRCPFLVFRERTFGKWLTIKAHPPHAERITYRYVWIFLARRRSEAVPLPVRPRTVAGRAVRCCRSAKILLPATLDVAVLPICVAGRAKNADLHHFAV